MGLARREDRRKERQGKRGARGAREHGKSTDVRGQLPATQRAMKTIYRSF